MLAYVDIRIEYDDSVVSHDIIRNVARNVCHYINESLDDDRVAVVAFDWAVRSSSCA